VQVNDRSVGGTHAVDASTPYMPCSARIVPIPAGDDVPRTIAPKHDSRKRQQAPTRLIGNPVQKSSIGSPIGNMRLCPSILERELNHYDDSRSDCAHGQPSRQTYPT
jgi:hypothetical protein